MATVRGVKPRVTTLVVGCLGIAMLALAGCGDDDPPDPGTPTTSAATTTGSTDSGDPTTSPPTEPSSASTGVAPASGPELHVKVTSLHVPEGFVPDESQFTDSDVSASGPEGAVQIFEIEHAADVSDDLRVQAFLDSQPQGTKTTRLPDVTLGPDQQHGLRFAWTVKGDPDQYQAVLVYRAQTSVSITFIIRKGADPQFVDAVLASVQWLL